MKKLDWLQMLMCAVISTVCTLVAVKFLSDPDILQGLVGIQAGEWLQAAAAVVGVFLTIRGTMWLEEKKREQARKEEQRLMSEAFVLLKAVLPVASVPLDEELDLPSQILHTRGHFEMVRVGMESLAYARQSYRVRSYNLWSSLKSIDLVHAVCKERIAGEENLVRGDNVTENVLAICREHIENYARELLAPVNAASIALDQEQR